MYTYFFRHSGGCIILDLGATRAVPAHLQRPYVMLSALVLSLYKVSLS